MQTSREFAGALPELFPCFSSQQQQQQQQQQGMMGTMLPAESCTPLSTVLARDAVEYLPLPAFSSATNASSFVCSASSLQGPPSATHGARASEVVFDIPIGDAMVGEVAASSRHISELSGAQVTLIAEPSGCALHMEGTAEAVNTARSLLLLALGSPPQPPSSSPASA
jgi:hypothetical protein